MLVQLPTYARDQLRSHLGFQPSRDSFFHSVLRGHQHLLQVEATKEAVLSSTKSDAAPADEVDSERLPRAGDSRAPVNISDPRPPHHAEEDADVRRGREHVSPYSRVNLVDKRASDSSPGRAGAGGGSSHERFRTNRSGSRSFEHQSFDDQFEFGEQQKQNQVDPDPHAGEEGAVKKGPARPWY